MENCKVKSTRTINSGDIIAWQTYKAINIPKWKFWLRIKYRDILNKPKIYEDIMNKALFQYGSIKRDEEVVKKFYESFECYMNVRNLEKMFNDFKDILSIRFIYAIKKIPKNRILGNYRGIDDRIYWDGNLFKTIILSREEAKIINQLILNGDKDANN